MSSTGRSATRSGASGWVRPIAPHQDYAREVRQYAAAMRKVDPSLVLIASGLNAEWDRVLVEQGGGAFDWISRHDYSPITQALTGPAAAAEFHGKAIRPREGVLPLLREARRALDAAGPDGRRIGIAFDEWNLWHNWFIKPFENEWHIGPIDAVFAAAQLNLLCQEAGDLRIPMAAMFEPVNEGAIRVQPFSADLTAMGQVFALYRAHHAARLLKTDPPRGGQALDVCASLSPDRQLVNVTIVNQATAGDRAIDLILAGGRPRKATVTTLSVRDLQPDITMDRRTQEVTPRSDGRLSWILPRFGIALIQVDVDDRP